MIDKFTFSEVVINLFIWLTILIANRQQIYYSTSVRGTNYAALFFIVVLYSTFAFTTGDYFNYVKLYNDALRHGGSYHLEPFFNWLIQVLPSNYSIWRLAVWGLSMLFLVLTFRRLHLKSQFASLIFVIILMFNFANLRNALGYVVLYYSATLLFFPSRHKLTSYAFGMIGIVCSYFLHKSMFAYIMLFLVALIPFSKWVFVGSLVLFPVLYKYVYQIASYILLSYGSETSQHSGTMYLESDFNQVANFNGLIQIFFHRFPIIILLALTIYEIYFRNKKIEFFYKTLVQYSYILIYISCLFYGQTVSAFFSSRFWDASLFPLTILFAYYLCNKSRNKTIKFSFYMLIIATLYDFAYTFYKYL